ncbi:MAG: retention module-containing protein [Methylophilales bacterium]|nr:retention module-containing protein [Methylophilales bacterium]
MANLTNVIHTAATLVKATGKVFVRHPDGTQSVLKVGAHLNVGDVVVTSPGAHAEIQVAEGQLIKIGSAAGDALTIDKSILDTPADHHDVKADAATDFNKIIENLAKGNDIGDNLDPTAAGNTGGGDLMSGNVYVVVEPIVTTTTPSPFENTNSLGGPVVNTMFSLLLANQEQPNNSPTISIVGADNLDTEITEGGSGNGKDVNGNPADGFILVNEAGLTNGTQASDDNGLTQGQGTFTVSDPDGLADISTVTINGVTFDLGSTPDPIIGSHGTLTITGYDNGVYSFTYELTSPVNGPATEGTDTVYGGEVFNITVTDNSGASGSANLNINVIDDVPSIAVTEGELPSISVDESYLINGSTPDDTQTSSTINFSTAFVPVEGADGATTTYAFNLDTEASSGLNDSLTGNPIVLVMNDAGESDVVAFTLTLDATTGEITLEEFSAVKQAVGTLDDTSEGVSIAANVLELVATVTDNDGDTATAKIDVGSQVNILDDGPSIAVMVQHLITLKRLKKLTFRLPSHLRLVLMVERRLMH